MLTEGTRIQFTPVDFDSWSYSDETENGFCPGAGRLTPHEFSTYSEDWSEKVQTGRVVEVYDFGDEVSVEILLDTPFFQHEHYTIVAYTKELNRIVEL